MHDFFFINFKLKLVIFGMVIVTHYNVTDTIDRLEEVSRCEPDVVEHCTGSDD